ncbi:MAG: HD domain-containing protein [Planctomycetaceae bacterium]|nr:HD domain-containing protein [Planctomycetaceae bacterium]
MSSSKLRQQIAWEAARLMYDRQESEYYRAKLKAAKHLCQGWVKPADLPTNREIRDEIQGFARMFERQKRVENLCDMRVAALRMMRLLSEFRPRLIGSVLTGHTRQGSDIDLHVFSDNVATVAAALEREHFQFEVERKQVRKQGEERVFTHIHVNDRFRFELTVYATSLVNFPFTSSITGKTIERANIRELEELLAREYPDLSVDDAVIEAENPVDRFQVYRLLLTPLEAVKQSPKFHPEGDALYHSLQVFDLACDELPYDEEFLLAALLHDVGKAIDPYDHVQAALEALEGTVGERTQWLIEHHMEAHALREGTLGARAWRRLRESEYYEDLLLLGKCDRGGREKGVETSDLDEALVYLRDLADDCES